MLPFLNPRSPNSMLSLCHGILPKVVSALFTTLNWGEGETKFVLSMFNNFAADLYVLFKNEFICLLY